jgi:aspartate ammonia-lyase
VAGNNLSLEHAVQASQLELGVMGPTIADSMIMSLKLTAEVLEKFSRDCVMKTRANKARCRQLLENSTAFAALLNPCLGYDKVAGLVEESLKTHKTIREAVQEQKLLTNKEFEKIVRPFKA